MCVLRNIQSASIISSNLIKLSLNIEKIVPEYFCDLMFFFKKVARLKTGQEAAYTYMNTGVLDNLIIPIPPLKLQEKYFNLRKQITFQKNRLLENKSALDEFFLSLNHRLFCCN